MGWSLEYLEPREPELCDSVFLAAGKSLYLANMFESKCRFVLQIANLDRYLTLHAGSDLTTAMAAAARDKMLGPTLRDLSEFPAVSETAVATLDRAREARNFIAHEGAHIGPLSSIGTTALWDHLNRLEIEVRLLALGDNIVSSWSYEITEKEPAPAYFRAEYPAMVVKWVFGALPGRTASS